MASLLEEPHTLHASKHTEPANPTTATGVTGSGSICQTLHFSMPARWLSFWDCFNARPVA